MAQFNKKKAFTLAEVLITLGIIGVVAAITIPMLMTKYHKIIVENRLKDSYSIMSNAVKMAEEEYGVGFEPTDIISGNGWSRDKSKKVFEKYFMPYLKINYEYPQEACVNLTKTYGYDKSIDSQYIDYNGACYNLMNGTSIIFWAGRKDEHSPYVMPILIRIQPTKERPIDGIDTFGFQIVNADNGIIISSGLEQLEADVSESNLVKQCGSKKGRIDFNGYSWPRSIFCSELIKRNSWKIPANYPLKF